MSVGRAIRNARKQARMSQYVLARKIGWSLSQVSRVETDDRHLEIRELAAIALALGISPTSCYARRSMSVPPATDKQDAEKKDTEGRGDLP